MKDYYRTLGLSEDAGDEDIRKAFRKLAFQYHPDKNIGHEKEAEQKFKDINEAYCVLSDKAKRRQYDMVRKGQFAGVGSGFNSPDQGFGYSQEDIFRDTFTNQATMEELNRMFAQAGLRFDPEFLNRTFFGANNVVFRVYTFGGSGPRVYTNTGNGNVQRRQSEVAPASYKPGLFERWAARTTMKLSIFVMKRLFGIKYEEPQTNLDLLQDLKVSASEAKTGGEKQFSYKIGRKRKKLMVKIPPGIQSGTQIRLKGMGDKRGKKTGDLYLKVNVTESITD